MSPRRLLTLFVLAIFITLAIAVSAQALPATTPNSGLEPNILNNKSSNQATKLSEVIIAKIQTLKASFNLRTPALVALNNRRVSANVDSHVDEQARRSLQLFRDHFDMEAESVGQVPSGNGVPAPSSVGIRS